MQCGVWLHKQGQNQFPVSQLVILHVLDPSLGNQCESCHHSHPSAPHVTCLGRESFSLPFTSVGTCFN